jgi:L-asparagine oxygenase
MKPAYTFTPAERRHLQTQLAGLRANPYRDPAAFRSEVCSLVPRALEISGLVNALRQTGTSYSEGALLIRNSPNDDDKPVFSNADPLQEKYDRKRTFVAEAFLELCTQLAGYETITFQYDNNGDFYHDVYAMESMADTQSQKATGSLGLHSDSANAVVRPERVNMICMRNSRRNIVVSTFTSHRRIAEKLGAGVAEVLGQRRFATPVDDLTAYGSSGRAEPAACAHEVICEGRVTYFAGRTRALDLDAAAALQRFESALAETLVEYVTEEDDFVSIENVRTLHGRRVEAVSVTSEHWARWLIKSYAIRDLAACAHHFVPGRDRVVLG